MGLVANLRTLPSPRSCIFPLMCYFLKKYSFMFYIRAMIHFELIFIKDLSFFFHDGSSTFFEKAALPLLSNYIEMKVFTHPTTPA